MMCSREVNTTAEGDHALLLDRFPDHGEGLRPDLTVRHDVVRAVEEDLVDLVAWHELVDLDRALALDRDRFELLGFQLDVPTLGDLVALDDLVRPDLVPGVGVDFPVLDPVTGVLIDLMEADLLPLRHGRKRAIGHDTRDSLR
jgi:hypothetical protein